MSDKSQTKKVTPSAAGGASIQPLRIKVVWDPADSEGVPLCGLTRSVAAIVPARQSHLRCDTWVRWIQTEDGVKLEIVTTIYPRSTAPGACGTTFGRVHQHRIGLLGVVAVDQLFGDHPTNLLEMDCRSLANLVAKMFEAERDVVAEVCTGHSAYKQIVPTVEFLDRGGIRGVNQIPEISAFVRNVREAYCYLANNRNFLEALVWEILEGGIIGKYGVGAWQRAIRSYETMVSRGAFLQRHCRAVAGLGKFLGQCRAIRNRAGVR